jgi:hypothetical protein
MASPEPLLPPSSTPTFKDRLKGGAKKGAGVCVGGCCVLYLVALVAQGLLYSFITAGCGPKAIGADYSFPGGGKSINGTAEFNLIPQLSLLSQRDRNMWGWAFDLLPANDAGATAGAQTGTFWRNNGILFYTFTYEDIANSKLTAYMRKNFWMPYMSFHIARCDGKGPTYTFTEGGNWISNKIRKFFKMNQAQTYLLYADGDLVANVQEINTEYPSLTLNDETTGKEKASAILKDRTFHGNSDQWYISNHFHDNAPYWVTAMLCLPTAYDAADDKLAAEMAKEGATTDKSSKKPTNAFLIESTKTGAKRVVSTDQLHQSTKIGAGTSGTGTDTSTSATGTGTATSGTDTGTGTGTATVAKAPLQHSADAEKKGDIQLQHV